MSEENVRPETPAMPEKLEVGAELTYEAAVNAYATNVGAAKQTMARYDGKFKDNGLEKKDSDLLTTCMCNSAVLMFDKSMGEAAKEGKIPNAETARDAMMAISMFKSMYPETGVKVMYIAKDEKDVGKEVNIREELQKLLTRI